MGNRAIAHSWNVALIISGMVIVDGAIAPSTSAQSPFPHHVLYANAEISSETAPSEEVGWDDLEPIDGVLLYPSSPNPETTAPDAEPVLLYPEEQVESSGDRDSEAYSSEAYSSEAYSNVNSDINDDSDAGLEPPPHDQAGSEPSTTSPEQTAESRAASEDVSIPVLLPPADLGRFGVGAIAPESPEMDASTADDELLDDDVLIYPSVTDPSAAESDIVESTESDTGRSPSTPAGDPDNRLPEIEESVEEYPVEESVNESPEGLPDPSLDSSLAPLATDVQIQGGDAELQQIIQEVISVREGRPADDAMLDADRVAIEGTGLVESVQVVTVPQPDGLAVTYVIDPIVVRSLDVSGAQVLPPEVVEEAFADQVDRPISPRLLNQGADAIDAWYLENGYSLSKVVAWLTDPSGHVIVEVVEPTIGDIAIVFVEDGSTVGADGEPVEGRTREEFILRELTQEPGDVFNQNELVRDVETLLSLGIFQDASVELKPDERPDDPTVDVVYRLEEGFARSLRVGGGISTELGLFGSVAYQDRNFRGLGEELDLGVQAGGRGLEFNTGFTSPYRESNPDRLGYSLNGFRQSFQSLTFSDEVPLANGDDAREQRFGGGVSVMRPLGEWDAELGFDYARVSIRDDDGDIATEDALGNSLTASDSGIDDLLTLGFQVTQDRRLNPSNPASGSVLRLRTEQSIPVGNGSILMNRLTASYAEYLPTDLFGSGSLRNPEVFAFNIQGGTILGELPPYEAFDLGGMNSVRGYAGGDVGSGRSYILTSAEYRFPLFSTLGGVLFTDFASDLGTGSSVEGDPAGSRDKPGTGFGYGFGLRFGSPIGLIRADFGFNDRGENQFHFGFGQRF